MVEEAWGWVGKGASASERVSAFPYAQKYLKSYKRPPVLPSRLPRCMHLRRVT